MRRQAFTIDHNISRQLLEARICMSHTLIHASVADVSLSHSEHKVKVTIQPSHLHKAISTSHASEKVSHLTHPALVGHIKATPIKNTKISHSKQVQKLSNNLTALAVAPTSSTTSRDQVLMSMRLAAAYYHDHVATNGGYLWKYGADLNSREGEKTATTTQIWVQPPGTPSVGLAFLTAYRATGDVTYLNDAVDAAHSLVQGQLRSGGWRYHIEFNPTLRSNFSYRVDPPSTKSNDLSNLSVLDDDTTTSALRLLMQVDQALGFKNASIHEATLYGLNALVKAQYPNGAWPQRFTGPSSTSTTLYPVQRASYPTSTPSRSPWYPNEDGQGTFGTFYTLNDNVMVNAIDTLLQASKIYNNASYLSVAAKGGSFLIRAQMPGAQPAWAQQYDFNTQPAWARSIEPPAIVTYESQFVLEVLMRVYQATGDAKYLAPIPKALDYLRASTLPDGNLARFYELKTNEPLYVTADHLLTHTPVNLVPGYAWEVKSQVDAISKSYNKLLVAGSQNIAPVQPKLTTTLETQATTVVNSLDSQGRWLTQGRLLTDPATTPSRSILDSAIFASNLNILSEYIASSK